jgi:hypothetical protein
LVVPQASKTRVVGVLDERLKVALAAPAHEGAANRALIKALAKWLGIPRSSVAITRGLRHRRKTINLAGIRHGEVEDWLSLQPKG